MAAVIPSGTSPFPPWPWLTEWITLAAVSLFLALAVHHFFLRGQKSDETVGGGQTLGVGKSPLTSGGAGDGVPTAAQSSKDILSELRTIHKLAPSAPPLPLPLAADATAGTNVVTNISSTEEWDRALLNSSNKRRPVVAKFTATWCKPCHAIDPFFVSLANKYDATFLRVDVDDFDDIAADCSVSSMPTFVVLAGKEIMGSVSGTDKQTVEGLCKKHCAPPKQHNTEEKGVEVVRSDQSSDAALSLAVEREEMNKPNSKQEDMSTTVLEQNQSSVDHPGLERYWKWHDALSGTYRSYSIATSSDVSPPIPDSKRTRSPLRILVTNATSGPIEACKIDQEGAETTVGNIGSGRTMRESGALGQPWAFREKGKANMLMVFVPHQTLPAKDGVGVYKFHILPPGLKAKQEGRVCDISDPLFPFPSTKISSVSKAVGWSVRQMEREWAEAASKTSYYRAPRSVLKYLQNIISAPSEKKFRCIRMKNSVFQRDVWSTAGKGVLLALGFEECGEFLQMGGSKSLTKERLEQVTDAAAQIDTFVCGKTSLPEATVGREEPRRSISEGIQNLFSSLEDGNLLRNGDGGVQERITLANAIGGKGIILLYASAHWCPPCRRFTPQLVQFYNITKQADMDSLEIVFLSADREAEAFQSYFAAMPWLAVPFESAARHAIKNYIQVRGIPRLCVIDGQTGRILEDNAVGMPLNIERWRALQNS